MHWTDARTRERERTKQRVVGGGGISVDHADVDGKVVARFRLVYRGGVNRNKMGVAVVEQEATPLLT